MSFKALKLSMQVGMTWYVTTNTNINSLVVLKLGCGALVETRTILSFMHSGGSGLAIPMALLF